MLVIHKEDYAHATFPKKLAVCEEHSYNEMFHKYALLNSLLPCRDNASIKAPRKVAMRTVAHAHPRKYNVESHSPAHNSCSKSQTSLLEAFSTCQTIETNKDHLCPGKDGTKSIS